MRPSGSMTASNRRDLEPGQFGHLYRYECDACGHLMAHEPDSVCTHLGRGLMPDEYEPRCPLCKWLGTIGPYDPRLSFRAVRRYVIHRPAQAA